MTFGIPEVPIAQRKQGQQQPKQMKRKKLIKVDGEIGMKIVQMVKTAPTNIIALQNNFFMFSLGTEPKLYYFISASANTGSQDDKRKQREEKRLARQKELEAKRAARKSGAMKLGSKMS